MFVLHFPQPARRSHTGSQSANGSATPPFSTCVWASVPDSYWAQLTGPLNEVLMTIKSRHKLSSGDQRTVSSLAPADTTTVQSIGSTTPAEILWMSPFATCVWESVPDTFVVQPVDSSREWTIVTESTQYMTTTDYCPVSGCWPFCSLLEQETTILWHYTS